MTRKIMYKKDEQYKYTYALPRNSKDLKMLVWDDYCIMNEDEIDYSDYFEDRDGVNIFDLEMIKNDSWKDIPALDVSRAFELLKQNEQLYYNSYADSIIEKEDFERWFWDEIGYISDLIIQDISYRYSKWNFQNEIKNGEYF